MSYKVTRFSEEDFEEGTTVERIYMNMMQPDDFVLTDRDAKYADVLEKAYGIIWTMRPPNEKKKLIGEINGGAWTSHINQIYHDAQLLYARFDEISPRILRGVATEKLRLLAEDMEKLSAEGKDENARAKAAEVARRSYETILKINGADKITEPKGRKPPELPGLNVHRSYAHVEEAELEDE